MTYKPIMVAGRWHILASDDRLHGPYASSTVMLEALRDLRGGRTAQAATTWTRRQAAQAERREREGR